MKNVVKPSMCYCVGKMEEYGNKAYELAVPRQDVSPELFAARLSAATDIVWKYGTSRANNWLFYATKPIVCTYPIISEPARVHAPPKSVTLRADDLKIRDDRKWHYAVPQDIFPCGGPRGAEHLTELTGQNWEYCREWGINYDYVTDEPLRHPRITYVVKRELT